MEYKEPLQGYDVDYYPSEQLAVLNTGNKVESIDIVIHKVRMALRCLEDMKDRYADRNE